jgi:hypothetical protein
MTERGVEREGATGGAERKASRLLFIVARGHADLRAAIERALEGLPGLEVVEDRRGDGTLLSRWDQGAGLDAPSSGDPGSDHHSVAGAAPPAPTLAIARMPRIAWSLSHPHPA